MADRPFTQAGFQAFLDERRLMGSRCAACGELCLPPRALCPRCFESAMEWFAFSGLGRLAGFTTIHVGLPAFTGEGYSRENPYCSGVVRLAEGPSISALIIGLDNLHPETIHVGQPLRFTFLEHGSGDGRQVSLAFQPDGG